MLTEEIPHQSILTNFYEFAIPYISESYGASCWFGVADGDTQFHCYVSSVWKSPLHGILPIKVLATFICLQGILTSTLEIFHTLTHHSPRKFLLIRNLSSVSRMHIIALSISSSISLPWKHLASFKNQVTKMSIHLFSQAGNNILRLHNLSVLSPYFFLLSPLPLICLLLPYPLCWVAVVEALTKSW